MDLKLDALLNEASRRADGLSDFGDERFRVPAQVLLSVHPLDAREADEEGVILDVYHSIDNIAQLAINQLHLSQA